MTGKIIVRYVRWRTLCGNVKCSTSTTNKVDHFVGISVIICQWQGYKT